MRRKGRVSEGSDADIVVFDPENITDQATYSNSTRPSSGIRHVLVNGTFVVRDGGWTPTPCPVGPSGPDGPLAAADQEVALVGDRGAPQGRVAEHGDGRVRAMPQHRPAGLLGGQSRAG